MADKKPWFLKSKKLGDYSYLRRNDFNELRSVVSKAVREYSESGWKKIKAAALIALAELAQKHYCTFRVNAEGGHICMYKNRDPVFALRIGNYGRHRVEDLLKGKALYRGIIDIVPWLPSPIPNNLSQHEEATVLLRQLRETLLGYWLLTAA